MSVCCPGVTTKNAPFHFRTMFEYGLYEYSCRKGVGSGETSLFPPEVVAELSDREVWPAKARGLAGN